MTVGYPDTDPDWGYEASDELTGKYAITSVTPLALATEWVVQLPNFIQTQEALKDGSGYCCLGVLVEIAFRLCPELAPLRDEWEWGEFHGEEGELPDWFANFVGLTSTGHIYQEESLTWQGRDFVIDNPDYNEEEGDDEQTYSNSLIVMNDEYHIPFDLIAKAIDEQLLPILRQKEAAIAAEAT